VADGVVTIRYRRGAAGAFTSRRARLALNGGIPWSIELEGGLTDLRGSLEGLRLARVEVAGGANHIDLDLPSPTGSVPIRVSGVVSDARLRRPTGSAAAVRVDGGVSQLRLDDRRLGRVAGDRRFESSRFEAARDRFEIELLGGASNVRVEAR
jgi:hypothetical protein